VLLVMCFFQKGLPVLAQLFVFMIVSKYPDTNKY